MGSLIVIGGGLAGCEAAWHAANYGIEVILYEMRPEKPTEAHRTGLLGELVCSNSLRSAELINAPGLLKEELRMAGSLIMQAAEESRVAAGSAFAVDRMRFAGFINKAVSENRHIRVVREEVCRIPGKPAVIATGPLTSRHMTDSLSDLLGQEHLYFYDAIAPILDAGSIDQKIVYHSSRYGKGGDDYLNCPMTKDEYDAFYNALIEADRVTPRQFEDEKVFEGCMPVEVMALRGRDTLRFGPMKPVGLADPRSGLEPYAVVQLRPENVEKSAYNIVGFQTRLKWPEQKRVFSMIPGLGSAEFLRYGSLHRNTFINSPLFLNRDLSLRPAGHVYMAGQITGVEGYIESAAMGVIAGINAGRLITGAITVDVPETTAHGALLGHITMPKEDFQPSNINFGLFPEIGNVRDKKKKRQMIAERALMDWDAYIRSIRQ